MREETWRESQRAQNPVLKLSTPGSTVKPVAEISCILLHDGPGYAVQDASNFQSKAHACYGEGHSLHFQWLKQTVVFDKFRYHGHIGLAMTHFMVKQGYELSYLVPDIKVMG